MEIPSGELGMRHRVSCSEPSKRKKKKEKVKKQNKAASMLLLLLLLLWTCSKAVFGRAAAQAFLPHCDGLVTSPSAAR